MSAADLQKKIRGLQQSPVVQPRQAWRLSVRETLLMQVGNSMPHRSPSRAFRLGLFARQLRLPRFTDLVRGPVAAIVSTLALLTGGSILSVSAAERAVPGDFLFPVKLATEQTRLALAANKTERLKLKTEFVARRIQEMQTIVATDVARKPERLKTAANILKQDLATMKIQLADVTRDAPAQNAAEAAKLVDAKSAEFATTLKAVKSDVTDQGVREQVGEVQVAAAATDVKAVQVLVDTHNRPEARSIVSQDDLVKSITTTVQTIESNINDTAQTVLLTSTTSSLPWNASSATSSASQIINAQQSLDQARQLLKQNKLDEVTTKLAETVKEVGTLQTSIDGLALSAGVSSTAATAPKNASPSDQSATSTTSMTTSTPAGRGT